MTAIATPPVAVPTPDPPGRVLLRGISWQAYRKLLADLNDAPIHLTYDDGLLEIEVPSQRHEQLKKLAAGLVDALLDAAALEYLPLASTTWSREDLLKAIEADECYYVQNVQAVQKNREIDLAVDPPPDLAIEVEVSTSAIDKLRVYSALRVPELWRIKEDASVRLLRRNAVGSYEQVSDNAVVPRATADLIEAQLKLIPPIGTLVHSAVLRQFRATLAATPPQA
jgi:Uma2 family endonuclease